jgi:hypothetical protein
MKHVMKYLFSFLLLLSFQGNATAQLSEKAQISLLTCAAGEDIYSLFGHSAIRIYDPVNNIDNCYNWGMFEFDEDQVEFATKFTKGRLKYYMDEQYFTEFMWEYDYFQRTVKEQVLNLTHSQKQDLWYALQENYLPENRVYKYDFFFDNCATRIRDILQNVMGENLVLKAHPNENEYSLRELLNNTVAHMPWLGLGMDLALGSKVDVKADNNKMMFLPKYMYEIYSESAVTIDGKKQLLVLKEHTLIKGINHTAETSLWTSPGFIFWSLFLISVILTIAKVRFLTKLWDGLLLLILGMLGITIFYLWFGTDHVTMRPNFNVLWANPLYVFFIIPLMSKTLHSRLNMAYLAMSIVLILVIFGAMIIPQEFNSATTPIILIFTLKFFYWYKETKRVV